jgi:hypothetical protein
MYARRFQRRFGLLHGLRAGIRSDHDADLVIGAPQRTVRPKAFVLQIADQRARRHVVRTRHLPEGSRDLGPIARCRLRRRRWRLIRGPAR